MENVFTRLCTLPHDPEGMEDTERFVPLSSLLGPFSFPFAMFRRRLQNGSQQFGDFANYPSDGQMRVKALNYKKLLDLILALFQKLRSDAKQLRVERVFCMLDGAKLEDVLRSRDLSEAYEHVHSFSFYFEFGADDNHAEDIDLGEVDDLLDVILAENLAAVRKARAKPEMRKKMRHAYFANRNATSSHYNTDKESRDFSETLTSTTDVGMFIEGSLGSSHMVFKEHRYMRQCPFAFSRMFSVAKLYGEQDPMLPAEYCVQDPIHGTCFDVCACISFSILSDDFSQENFTWFAFPDILQMESTFLVPLPEDACLSSRTNLEIDRTVNCTGKSAFTIFKERLRPAVIALNENREGVSFGEKIERRNAFLEDAFPLFKSLFQDHLAISQSLKGMISKCEILDEVHTGVPFESQDAFCRRGTSAHPQQKLLRYLYDVAEDLGIYCHHTTFVQVLLDSRWACAKKQERGPHTILFGEPGTGKSHVLDMAKECMPRYMYEKITNMSTLSWAVNNDSSEENPDEHLAQIALFFDEMQASLLGADGAANKKDGGSKGENTDRTAMFKEMCSAPTLSYRRNVEAKDKEGLSTRVLEKGVITSELVIFAGMNRPPSAINDAFNRRFEMKACIFTPRKDKLTFEEIKTRDQESRKRMLTNTNSVRKKHLTFLHMNSDLTLVLSLAEFAGIVHPPNTYAWDRLVKIFKKVSAEFGTNPHLESRLDDSKLRLELFLKMYAVKQVYQSEDSVMSFDAIVKRLPETEKHMVATEATSLAFLAGFEETVFPMMHKLIVFGVRARYAAEIREAESDVEDKYVALPVALTSRKMDDDYKSIAKKSLWGEIQSFVYKEKDQFKLKKADDLSLAAIEELMETMVGKDDDAHTVLKAFEDENGRVKIMFSKLRLRNYKKDITDVLRECLHSKTKKQDILLLAAERSWNETTEKCEYEPKNPQVLRVPEDGEHRQRNLFPKSLFKEAKKIHEEIICQKIA